MSLTEAVQHGVERGARLGRDGDLRAPARWLDPHRAARALALPGDGGLRFEPGDLDLSKRREVLSERVRITADSPQLGRRLDEGPDGREFSHLRRFSPRGGGSPAPG